MTPTDFPQANVTYGPPPGVAESQVASIRAYRGPIAGGSNDGQQITVVAWLPTAEEVMALAHGQPLYLTFFGGLPPHMPTTHFELAAHPA